jgi:hypothetical protein
MAPIIELPQCIAYAIERQWSCRAAAVSQHLNHAPRVGRHATRVRNDQIHSVRRPLECDEPVNIGGYGRDTHISACEILGRPGLFLPQ